MNGRPVSSMTSKRGRSCAPLAGPIAIAAAGSRSASSPNSALDAHAAAGPPRAVGESPDRWPETRCRRCTAWTYRPDPPTRIGVRPRSRIRSTARSGLLLVPRDGGRFDDIENVQQVVRDPTTLRGWELGGADVHPAVQLHGIGVHDFPLQPFGEVQREFGLAGAGRAGDNDQRPVIGARRVGLGLRVHEPIHCQRATR